MGLLQVDNGIKILRNAIEKGISINKSIFDLGFTDSYMHKVKSRIDRFLEEGKITQEDYDAFHTLFREHEETIGVTIRGRKESRDLSVNDNYDERSSYELERDEDGRIVKYKYHILVRDSDPIIGELSREQMEIIYANNPYVTANTCSSYFPYLTFDTFNKIKRVFKITKDRIFPQHILEEKTDEQAAELALKNKYHAATKKFVEQKSVYAEKTLRDVQKELFELKEDREWIKDRISELFNEKTIIPLKLKYDQLSPNEERALNIYLSDHHVGACNKGAQYSSEYTPEVYMGRLTKILSEVEKQKHIYGKFDKIHVVNLGDALDGWNAETTRGGHKLQQNLDNKEQFRVYMESMILFFRELHKLDIGNKIEFISVGSSNHGGDSEYNANLALKHIFEEKYPDVSFRIFNKFMEHFEYGNTTIIACHGKDDKHMKKNFPLHIDDKTEKYIVDYCLLSDIKLKKENILFVKGDLHQYATQLGKNFRYTNMPSIYGSSPWIQLNFGYTIPAFVYQIINKFDGKVIEGYIDLK